MLIKVNFVLSLLLAVGPTQADERICFTQTEKEILQKLLIAGRPMTFFRNQAFEIRFPSHRMDTVPKVKFLKDKDCSGGSHPYHLVSGTKEYFSYHHRFILSDEGVYVNVSHVLNEPMSDDYPHAFTKDGKPLRKNAVGKWEPLELFKPAINYDVERIEYSLMPTWWTDSTGTTLWVRLTQANKNNLGIENALLKDPRIRYFTALAGERVFIPVLKSVKLNCLEASPDGIADCPIDCHYIGHFSITAKSGDIQEVFLGKQDIRAIQAIHVDTLNAQDEDLEDIHSDEEIMGWIANSKVSEAKIQMFASGPFTVYFLPGEFDTRSYLFYAGKKIFEVSDEYGSSSIQMRFKMLWEGKTKYLFDYIGKMGHGGSFIVKLGGEEIEMSVFKDEIDCADQGC